MTHKIDSLLETESHSTEAERTMLGALLIDPEAIFKIDARVQDSDFYDPIHAAIYKGIHELSGKGIAVDFVTVTDKLQEHDGLQKIGGSAFLAQLASDIPTSSHIEQYAEIVLEHSRKRQLTYPRSLYHGE
jgi:replicative DNA helicase